MKIAIEKTEGVLVIHVEGRLDSLTSGEFEKELTPLMQQSKQPVLIDFSKLDYISSAGMRLALILTKEMKKNDNALAFCCLNETIMEIFCISGFDELITIYPTIEEGIYELK